MRSVLLAGRTRLPRGCGRAAGRYGEEVAHLLSERDEGWTIELSGWQVDRCSFDFQTRLSFLHPQDYRPSGQANIALGSPFSLSLSGSEVVIDPEGPPEALSPVLGLLRQTVEGAFFEKSGTLNLTFRGGAHLRCDPDPQYEAWHLVAPDGVEVICVPGGGEPTTLRP